MEGATLAQLRAEDVDGMDYNQLIGVVRETNRPPGGLRSVMSIARHAFLRPGQRILDIGTSTGFTAIELSRLTGVTSVGIDINPTSLDEARRRAVHAGVPHLCHFAEQDATRLAD